MLAAKDIYFLKQEKVMIKTGPPRPAIAPICDHSSGRHSMSDSRFLKQSN